MEKTENAIDVKRIYRALSLESDLDGVDLRVFLYLTSTLDFKTFVPVQQLQIAGELGRRKEHVSRSIRKLKEKGIIIPGPKVDRSLSFRLNPNYGK